MVTASKRRSIFVLLPGLGVRPLSRRAVFVIAAAAPAAGLLAMSALEKLVRPRLIFGGVESDAALMMLPYLAFGVFLFAAVAWLVYACLCSRIYGPLFRLKGAIQARTQGRRPRLALRDGDYFVHTAELLNREWAAADTTKRAARELALGTMDWLSEKPSEERFEKLLAQLEKLLILVGERSAADQLAELELVPATAACTRRSVTRLDTVPPWSKPNIVDAPENRIALHEVEPLRAAPPRRHTSIVSEKVVEGLEEVIKTLRGLRANRPERAKSVASGAKINGARVAENRRKIS